MSIPQNQLVDLLYKQAFGVTKTDTEENKSPSNESIPSPLLIRGDTIWTQADQIPGTAAATAGIVQAYTGASAVECVADNTTVPISGVYPTWLTNLTYWIPAEFGATYNVQVWVDDPGAANPTLTGTQIFAAGSGGTGQFYFNYQSGVLNFIGETIPAALTSSKVLYIIGYRYIGDVGINNQASNTNIGNLNFTNVTISSTLANANIELAPNGTGVVNTLANVHAPYFIGNVVGNISGNLSISAPNTAVVYSANGSAVGSNAFTFDYAGNILTVTGNLDVENADLGNLAVANYVNVANELNGNIGNFSGNIIALNANLGNLVEANFASFADNVESNNFTVNLEFVANTANFSGNVILPNLTVNAELVGNTANFSGNVILPNLTVNTEIVGNIANFSGNLTSLNADLGNLATANYVNVANDLNGNVANFTGNLTAANAALGNLATANYVNVANDLNVVGNVNAGNLVGPLANGTSNVKVYQDANVEISVAGNANVATITGTGLLVAGNIQATTGNVLANGNVTANGFLVGGNASVTGEANVGSLKTANITATTGDIAINAGANGTIDLIPNGTGTVSVNGFRITQVPDPVDPTDATNKEYVDALAGEGLVIHTPVRVESPSALTATYAQGGTTPTVTDIVNGTDIVFSASHGLSVNDGIVFANTFNGLTAGEAYWVYSVANSTAITVKDGYFGTQVTGLTNGTGLTQGSRANPGVGATLTNAGANAALTIDGISLANNDRVLVYTQSNAFENGIYDVTDSGNGSAQWVLTRSTDFDTYIPGSSSGLGKGSYVFVTEGLTGAGESYVMTAPAGEVIIGTDNVTFTQFSAAGSYSAGNGINITGSIISANVDGVTTDIVSGNIVVKASANLTTPNIGDATFSSLSWNTLSNGNVTANNLSISNIANITLDLTVGGNIQANGTISANANVSGLNLTTNGNVTAAGDVVANNVTGNTLLTVPTANVSNIVNAGNVTVTNELSGNTANFSGNVVVPNLSVNLELAGNTANFTGNITSLNADLGNLATANYVNVANDLNGNVANFSGNLTALNADLGNLATANYVNAAVDVNATGNVNANNVTITNELDGNTANFSGNVTAAYFIGNVEANITITASNTTVLFSNSGLVEGSNAFTFDFASNALSLTGNANVSGNIETGGILTDNYYYANGSPVDFQQAAGSNTEIQFNSNNDFGASANLTFDSATNTLTVAGNANVTTLNTSNVVGGGTDVTINANGYVSTFYGANGFVSFPDGAVVTGNLTSGNAALGNLATANFANIASNVTTSNLTVNLELSGNTANFSGNVILPNLTVNNEIVGNTANFSGNVVVPNLTVNLELTGNTANFSGNVILPNLTVNNEIVGNTANFSGNVVVPNLSVNLELSGNTANFTGNIVAANANLGNLVTANFFTGTLINGNSNIAIPTVDGNVNITANGNTSLVVTETGANISGNLAVTGNLSANNFSANTVDASISVGIGNTDIKWGTVTTTSITANQAIAEAPYSGITGIEFLIKGEDSTGGKYSVAHVTAVTDGSNVDFSTYGTVYIGGTTGTLSVGISGSNLVLQVTPSSSNSTIWTTQYRLV